ncbi:flagellar hook-length control protein FliK [Halomonas koreensis]|uniref:Flagellar hook-length control protein FliK n=1 Tax=Halomonas koreensis TaxID=245385 RepID=A0ABU1G0L2_9GAMM|nr:flagellar hook-length control protein FliK [Halomonas koreensis]MDR5866452.1 flagellar hook-length control protein FliK [Halomonas koreensis]
MDIQQILAASQGRPTGARADQTGDAPRSGDAFAETLTALSPAARPLAEAGAAPNQEATPRQRLLTANDTGEAREQVLPETLKGLAEGHALSDDLKALLAEDAPLPDDLKAMLARADRAARDGAGRLEAAAQASDDTEAATMPALVAAMQRLTLIQTAGTDQAPGAAAGAAAAQGASLATLAAGGAATLPGLAAAKAPGAAVTDARPAESAGSGGGQAGANPLLALAQGRPGGLDAARIAPTTLEALGQQDASGQAPLKAAPAPGPQALFEALTGRRDEARHGPAPTSLAIGQAGLNGAAAAGPAATPGSGAQAASLPQQASLTTPVDNPAWPRQLGQQLIRFGQAGGEQRIEMKLHPAELGPLSVTLKMGDQGAQAHFLSAHAQVRQTLEQAIPQLRETLAEQGISLAETSVGEQQQGGADGDDPAFVGLAGQPTGEGDAGIEGDPADEPLRQAALDGRVDLYA